VVVDHSPAFGQADLSNCERELIHLAGSIQPHGVLLVLRERDGLVVQVSANCADLLSLPADRLLMRPLSVLGGDLEARVRLLSAVPDLAEPRPLQAHTQVGAVPLEWSAVLHRVPGQGVLVLELEAPSGGGPDGAQAAGQPGLMPRLSDAVQRFGQAASIGVLCDGMAHCVRDLTGYDRVMVYKFDPDGHGRIIAEARHPRLETLLGHQYPSTDIPQRARALYLANRVRVLVDVHYQPAPLVPAQLPADPEGGRAVADELDMSMCALRSMSPLHLQYLKNMGVVGTLVVSLVREGRLWGLIAAHHNSARALSPTLRAACDLLAEVAATRIAAIENYAHAQVAILVRRLEQRLVEATSSEGDWRLALFRNPRTLLQPLEATGAALFHGGEWLTTGDVPSTPELRELLQWVEGRYAEAPFATASVGKDEPLLDALTPVASGVLAVRLSNQRPDYLMWFRKEQLRTVTWAGDPAKPTVNDDPLTLSPRRSFAAWSEIVRGTALPWSAAELALGRAIGASLVDIIVQVNAVRLLVAEHQLAGVRATVQGSHEPVAIADGNGQFLFANPAFADLLGCTPGNLDAMAAAFADPALLRAGLDSVQSLHQTWRGELSLTRGGSDDDALSIGVRIELVPGRDGQVLGYILVLSDLRDSRRAVAARRHLEDALHQAGRRGRSDSGADIPGTPADQVISAILTNASLAAMDIADSSGGPGVAPLLEEVEASARRAAGLYARIRQLG
jgi:light-regulated signal transduction histidine kinase (bacteriophytochrome)